MESVFSNVSTESIIKVFECVCSGMRISKKDIALQTGLSVMTVGKITDGLRKAHVLRSSKQQNVTPGRRASELYPDPTKSIIVIDETPSFISVDVFDMTLRIRLHKEMRHEYCTLIDTETTDFIKSAIDEILMSYKPERCIGIGLIFQGKYIPETERISSFMNSQMSSLDISGLFKQYFPGTPLICISSRYAAAAEIAETERDNFLYVRIGERDITAVPVFGGIPICERYGDSASAGNMIISGISASSKFSMSKTPDDAGEAVARLVAQCRAVVPFHKVYIDVTEYKFCDFYNQICEHLKGQPLYVRDIQVYKCENHVSRIFTAKEVRGNYIGRIIEKYCGI